MSSPLRDENGEVDHSAVHLDVAEAPPLLPQRVSTIFSPTSRKEHELGTIEFLSVIDRELLDDDDHRRSDFPTVAPDSTSKQSLLLESGPEEIESTKDDYLSRDKVRAASWLQSMPLQPSSPAEADMPTADTCVVLDDVTLSEEREDVSMFSINGTETPPSPLPSRLNETPLPSRLNETQRGGDKLDAPFTVETLIHVPTQTSQSPEAETLTPTTVMTKELEAFAFPFVDITTSQLQPSPQRSPELPSRRRLRLRLAPPWTRANSAKLAKQRISNSCAKHLPTRSTVVEEQSIKQNQIHDVQSELHQLDCQNGDGRQAVKEDKRSILINNEQTRNWIEMRVQRKEAQNNLLLERDRFLKTFRSKDKEQILKRALEIGIWRPQTNEEKSEDDCMEHGTVA